MTFHRAELFGSIQYTALVGTTLVGYYLNDGQTVARVHRIVPVGKPVLIGYAPVSFPHNQAVARYVESVA